MRARLPERQHPLPDAIARHPLAERGHDARCQPDRRRAADRDAPDLLHLPPKEYAAWEKAVPCFKDRDANIGQGLAKLIWQERRQDALHRAWVAVGERLASFNGKLRDELLDWERFYTLMEVRVLTKRYRRTYNRIRPHRSLGYRPPATEALLPAEPFPVLVGLA